MCRLFCEAVKKDIVLHAGSLQSYPSLFHEPLQNRRMLSSCSPELVAEVFEDGFSTMNANSHGTHYLLAALQQLQPECRF
jgi:GDPmannose 4,6-dehydratase